MRVARDLVVRETAGDRPHRSRGFRVDVETLGGGTTVVHHYGHGGGGFSLSWGTGEMAVALLDDLDAPPERTPVAVLGAGAVGLATARLLQERGHDVEILSADPIDATTSAVAGASWYPVGVFAGAPTSEARGELFERAARRAHARFADLAGRGMGVRWGDEYVPDNSPARIEAGHGWVFRRLRDLYPGGELLEGDDHPFATRYALRYRTLFMDAPVYLGTTLAAFREDGGRFTLRRFASIGEVRSLPHPVVFNCTGVGARDLFGDHTLTPVRGRLFHLDPQPGVDYGVQIDDFRYVVPRASALLLGTSWEPAGTEIVQEGRDAESVIPEIARVTG